MATRRSSNIKRARPASSRREADARWGLGNAGAAGRGELPAYTAEHFDQDDASGVIDREPRQCPQHQPYQCRPSEVPSYYRSTLTTMILEQRDGQWPRRWRLTREICFECRCLAAWRHEKAVGEDLGLEALSYARVSIVDQGEAWKAMAEREAAERRQLAEIAGKTDKDLDWYDVRILLATCRRCLAAWLRRLAQEAIS